MTSFRGTLPAAVGVTIGLLLLASHDAVVVAIGVGLLANFLVPAMWAVVAMELPRTGRLVVGFLVAIGIVTVSVGWREGAAGAGLMTCGILGGWTLARGWQLLPLLTVAAAPLVLIVALGLAGSSPVAVTEDMNAENRRVFETHLDTGLSESERAEALARFDYVADAMLIVQRRFWPSLVAVGLVVQAALALALGWLLARIWNPQPPRPAWRGAVKWRAPFASVWMLVAGLAAAVSGRSELVFIGWNLAVVAALLLAIHGLAVQIWFVQRVLPPAARALYWIVGMFLFAPALVGSGVLVGLIDQWFDLRRAGRDAVSKDDDET